MQIEQNIPLAPLTTLRIGGPARFFARATTESDLVDAVHFARERKLALFVLGGGSNLVVRDEGFPGLVLHTALLPSIVRTDTPDGTFFDVSAGTDWDSLVLHVCEQGLSGMECLAGIPGFVGGAPIQNIGAYGQEVSQTIERVRALDMEGLRFVELSADECRFSYRRSVFNSTHLGRYIVSSVRFMLSHDATPHLTYADLQRHFASRRNPTPLEVYAAVRQIRAAKGMLIDPANPSPDARSAGSFFKNPVVSVESLERIAQVLGVPLQKIPNWPIGSEETKLAAAWLIEQAGFPKGFTLGPAGISSRHTLALINRSGSATCTDLLRLRDTIAGEVARRFHVVLEQEPVFLAPATG